MRWPELPEPDRMQRVAVVAPTDRLARVLLEVGRSGQVDLDAADEGRPDRPSGGPGPDIEAVAGRTVRRGPVAATAGWCPADQVDALSGRLAGQGGSLVRLRDPAGSVPPTRITTGPAAGAFQPLVDTYGTVPYHDLDPATVAGLAYVLMFGMMFADVGHGLLLAGAGLLLGAGRPARLARWKRLAPFVIGCGLSAAGFGALFGEAFGPTGLVPVVWLEPLDHPIILLEAALVVGAVLLAVSYGLGIVNRWRESGPVPALLALSGGAGAALYSGLAIALLGVVYHLPPLILTGATLAFAGLVVGFVGCLAGSVGQGGGILQAVIEMFDASLRIGSNTVSFTRLAAFGLTHAALGEVIWNGTRSLWASGPAGWPAAAVLFLAGTAVAFLLEGLVAGVQALRLEYYEMFSRVFVTEGRPFRPWRLPGDTRNDPVTARGRDQAAEKEALC